MRSPEELVRLAVGPDGGLVVGRTAPGRGVWLCRGSARCAETAVRRKALERALRRPLGPGAADELRARLREAGEQERGSEEPGP